MTDKELIETDNKKMSLSEVIKRKIKRNCSFFELENDDKRMVLDYIKSHSIDIQVFGQRWYDVISKKFYVDEYAVSENSVYGIKINTHSFDNFTDYIDFLKHDIYRYSCYYGYKFNDDEISKYSLDLSKMNFDSFISETIDNYSFERLSKIENFNRQAKISRSKEMVKWLANCKSIITVKELEKKRNAFTRKFDLYNSGDIFFSYLIRTQKENIREALMEFVSNNGSHLGVSFDDVLINYGRESSLKVIDNYRVGSSTTIQKSIREFKSLLEEYCKGALHFVRRISFDGECQMYFVRDTYYRKINCSLHCVNYFASLSELAEFVGNDFRGADLSHAPISADDLKGYRIDETTIFPLDSYYSEYLIKKEFLNGEFVVKQIWLDSKKRELKTRNHSFKIFFDFVHFLKNDLSESDLIMCGGIGNIKNLQNLNLQNIRVRSEAASLLGLPIRHVPRGVFDTREFQETINCELQTLESFEAERIDDEDYSDQISYISDIHLSHRFSDYNCHSYEDYNYVIRLLAQKLGDNSSSVNLIAGDTSDNFDVFRFFAKQLSLRTRGSCFYVLGNHELWDLCLRNKKLPEIVEEYRKASYEDNSFYLVHNNLFYLNDHFWNEIPTDVLTSISVDELRAKMRGSKLIIFGGLGFAGKNTDFNAYTGMYITVINREEEIKESEFFFALYEKVTEALKGMNLIVLTHMPMSDWGGDIHAKEGVVYVNGHTHENYSYDDGKKRIYADNQVGYKGKNVRFKKIAIDFGYNWFADYKDGIYEITRDDYERYYRGFGENLSFNREFANLYMIKREETYIFLIRTSKGSLQILNGGSIRKAGNHDLEYFYENLPKYSKSVSMFLSKYDSFQKSVSSEIKRIGGDGRIHGSIIDIDFHNHLYLNPLDGTVTAYFAYSMVDKYVYDNALSLLKYECPKLFERYQRFLNQNNDSNALVVFDKNLPITNKKTYVGATEIYKISRILKGLQFTTKYNTVRLWNDNFVNDSSEENGRLIVSGIIDPNSVPQVIETNNLSKTIKTKTISRQKPILSPKESAKKKLDEYKARIERETKTIEVVEYTNSTTKAKYKCCCCGWKWSVRPDHFKDRQNYMCPKCKK